MQKAVERFVLISWVDRHRDMNRDGPRLPNPVNPVITLLLYGRVPPAREVNYVCGSRERQTHVRARSQRISVLTLRIASCPQFDCVLRLFMTLCF